MYISLCKRNIMANKMLDQKTTHDPFCFSLACLQFSGSKTSNVVISTSSTLVKTRNGGLSDVVFTRCLICDRNVRQSWTELLQNAIITSQVLMALTR